MLSAIIPIKLIYTLHNMSRFTSNVGLVVFVRLSAVQSERILVVSSWLLNQSALPVPAPVLSTPMVLPPLPVRSVYFAALLSHQPPHPPMFPQIPALLPVAFHRLMTAKLRR